MRTPQNARCARGHRNRAAHVRETRGKCVVRSTSRAASPGPRATSTSRTTASALGAAAAALGAIHDRGEGVPRSLARAAIWYTEAENHGDEIAAERLEELRAETRDIFKGMRFV